MSNAAQDLSIPQTQKIAIFDKKGGPVVVKEGPVTQAKDLKPGEVLVKLAYSGVCHTDLHVMLGDWPLQSKVPCVGGHEGAGYVVAIADNTHTDIKIGQAVGIKWLADSCLNCEQCNNGNESTCAHAICHGFSVDGSFQQYAVSYARHVTPIPEGLSLDAAAPLLCAGETVWKAVKAAKLTAGQYILISGAGGGLGHLAVQYAAAIGLRVIALDTGNDKKELCASLGAETFIDFITSGPNLVEDIKKATGGQGPHAAVVAASGAKAYEQALDYLRSSGTLVAVGLPADAYIKANVFFTVFRNLNIVGSYVGNRLDAVEALDFAARGKVATTYKIRPLGDLPQVYEEMKSGTTVARVVLDLWA